MCLGWVFSIYSQLYQPFSDGAVGLAASMLNSQFAMPFRAQVGPVNVVCVHVCSFHQSISKQKHKTGKSLSTLMHAWKVCPSLRDEITTHDLFVIMVSLLPNKYPMIYLQVLHYLLWMCSPLPPSKAQEKLLPVGKWPGMQVWPLWCTSGSASACQTVEPAGVLMQLMYWVASWTALPGACCIGWLISCTLDCAW